MNTLTIQRQYDEVIAPYYDLDPQAVIAGSLDRALAQIQNLQLLDNGGERLKVLDVGMGTGLFLAKLKAFSQGRIQPFGLDLSANMIETARLRIPDLVAEVADAVHLDACFRGRSFDLVSIHFVTGFVPMRVLLPKIWDRLAVGGYLSLVGGTKASFPALQEKGDIKLLRLLCGVGNRTLDEVLLNPADQNDAVKTLEAYHFEVCAAETFEPAVNFPDFDAFMEFGHRGGWFTPIIEALNLHKAGASKRWLLNRFLFPVQDHHNIAIVLARKGQK